MGIMLWLRNLWWARQRALDIKFLWPFCKEGAEDLNHARRAFLMHAIATPCWVLYYGEGLWEAIEELT